MYSTRLHVPAAKKEASLPVGPGNGGQSKPSAKGRPGSVIEAEIALQSGKEMVGFRSCDR